MTITPCPTRITHSSRKQVHTDLKAAEKHLGKTEGVSVSAENRAYLLENGQTKNINISLLVDALTRV